MPEPADALLDPAAMPGADGRTELLVRALATIAPRQRAAVVLRYCADLPITDVAATLGCSEGTVKSQTARGLASLRGTVERWQARDLYESERRH